MSTKGWHDYYEILGLYDPEEDFGLGPDATVEQIRRAWKSELAKWHPDVFSTGTPDWNKANERTTFINVAFSVLSNPVEKERYDREWHQRRREHKGRVSPGISVTPSPPDSIDKLLDGIPLGETRELTLVVRATSGSDFRVRLEDQLPSWMEINTKIGTPPFEVKVRVNTAGMAAGEEKEFDLIFLIEGREGYRLRIAFWVHVVEEAPEIFVTPSWLNSEFSDMAQGEKRTATLLVERRCGAVPKVNVKSSAPWLWVSITKGGVPPFEVNVTADASNLEEEKVYRDKVLFSVDDLMVASVPVVLRVKHQGAKTYRLREGSIFASRIHFFASLAIILLVAWFSFFFIKNLDIGFYQPRSAAPLNPRATLRPIITATATTIKTKRPTDTPEPLQTISLTPTEITSTNQTSFSDDFSNPESFLTNWEQSGGIWSLDDGILSGSIIGEDGLLGKILVGEKTWTNYTIEVDMNRLGENRDSLIYFGYKDENSNYWIDLRTSGFDDVRLYKSGNVEPLAIISYKNTFREWYKIRIVTFEETIRVYIDDRLVLQEDIGEKIEGVVGLGITTGRKGNSTILFDNFEVTGTLLSGNGE